MYSFLFLHRWDQPTLHHCYSKWGWKICFSNLLNFSLHLYNKFDQDENSMQLLWNQHPRLILHQNWLTVLCIFLIWYLFIFCRRKWRMFWILPVFDLVDTSIFLNAETRLLFPLHGRSLTSDRFVPVAQNLNPSGIQQPDVYRRFCM